MTVRLRQVVVLVADLEATLAEARAFLGLKSGVRDVDGMAKLGFEHEVLAIDETFVEIVSPLTPESSPGRLLARRGECGYMVVLEVPALDDVVRRGAGLGMSPVMHEIFEGNPISQWHPRDLGTLAEIDEMRTAEWHFFPELGATGSTAVVDDVVAVEVATPDPAGCAARWAGLLGLDLADGATVLELGSGRVEFVAGEGGLRRVRLSGERAAAQELGGVRFEIVPRSAA